MITEARKKEIATVLAYGLTDKGFLDPQATGFINNLDEEEKAYLMDLIAQWCKQLNASPFF